MSAISNNKIANLSLHKNADFSEVFGIQLI